MALMVKTPAAEMEELLSRSTRLFAELALAMARAVMDASAGVDQETLDKAANLIRYTQAQAHLFGGRRLLLEVDARRSRYGIALDARYEAEPTPLVPRVDAEEAILDMARREPRLARTAEAVAEIYNTSHGFALAKSMEEAVTRRVQEYIQSFLLDEGRRPDTSQAIADLGGWARAYGETVFRTNVTTAYASGRLAMATDPEVSGFVVGLRRVEVLDADTRPNHRASHGIMAPADSPVWADHGVPGGYGCRGVFEIVDRIEAGRMGIKLVNGKLPEPRIPPGAYNDKGFTGKTFRPTA